jgi:hypothetical protein
VRASFKKAQRTTGGIKAQAITAVELTKQLQHEEITPQPPKDSIENYAANPLLDLVGDYLRFVRS